MIPEPSNSGVSYTKYLEELAEKRAPLFLCHFYNIYFSHIAGGQVIARQVDVKLMLFPMLKRCFMLFNRAKMYPFLISLLIFGDNPIENISVD